jgi:stress responsive alpha/beta barrel protein
MIRHCLLFRWLPDTTDDQVDAAAKLLLEYVATLDGVASYRLGRDVGVTDGTYDFAIVGDFETREAYVTYRDSPRHVEISKGIVTPLLAERASVQFEID